MVVVKGCLLINIDLKIKTLLSLVQVDNYPLYTMSYYCDYNFNDYLKKGCKTTDELIDFASTSLNINEELKHDKDFLQECTCFWAKDSNNNSIYCRNLDLKGNSHLGLLLYTHSIDGYASVSMVELATLGYWNNTEDRVANLPSLWENRKKLLIAPYEPRDGMNEFGLAVSTLNAPFKGACKDNKKVTIGRWQANRLMLDYAKNVDEAITLLRKYNIELGNAGVHFLIADSTGKSAVIEFFNNDMRVTYNKESWQVSTNFLVSDPDREGFGQDRYDIACEVLKRNEGKISEKDAMKLLRKVTLDHTVWSVVYNLHTGNINIAMGRKFDEIKTFNLNMRKQFL